MRTVLFTLLLTTAAPAFAQDHAGHAEHEPATKSAETDCQKEAERHRAMGHPVPEGQCEPGGPAEMDHKAMDHSQMDHGQMEGMDHDRMDHDRMKEMAPDTPQAMDHGTMDHGAMDHSQMDHSRMQGMDHSQMDHGAMEQPGAAEIPFAPPPPGAGSGPPRAADAIWGADAMRASRDGLPSELGDILYYWVQGDRMEYRAREGEDGYLWDLQGYYGGDLDKFWFKSEGEGSFGEEIESAEVQALYSRAIAPFFDLQAGIRQDFVPMDRTYAVVGIQGLAPYLFEIDAAAFLSDRGDLTARVEAELDQRITQRLILQPRVEASFSAQDVPELGIGAGLDSVEAGLRLRYHFAREFAPYIGVDQEWRIGQSADYARAEGEDPSVTNYVVGIRFWF
ncbi:copper resistance protein CopB [Erythrobacter sp. QSSC1-22B]|uniref:copper resistance protein B n=1 Tax=Erythrobacter sp. QSSC1-22B TaxID=1860125 RepID=UPI00080558DB|nr:copper resistance protein B [Erythrobacter sp. QSSC1-22B]OBX18952.1 copper resistance protein CopB [Erythrobacter sp. QSSC1-22B]